jgi:hypothetical protein
LDQKPTAEIGSVAEGARAGERTLTGGTWSVSDKRGESALTERAQRQRGNGWLPGSEGVRTVRSRSNRKGSEGSEGGPRGPNRLIKIGRGKVRPGWMSGYGWR